MKPTVNIAISGGGCGCGAGGVGAAAPSGSGGASPDDPRDVDVRPEVEDTYVASTGIDDPRDSDVKPEVEDSEAGGGGGGGSPDGVHPCSCAPAPVIQCGGCCCEEAGDDEEMTPCGTPEYSGFVIVAMAAGFPFPGPLGVTENALWKLGQHYGLEGLLELIAPGAEPPGVLPAQALRTRPLIDLETGRFETSSETWQRIAQTCPREGEDLVAGGVPSLADLHHLVRCFEAQAARTDFPPSHSLTSFYRVDARHLGAEAVQELVLAFEELPAVAFSYRELEARDTAADVDYRDLAPIGTAAGWAMKQLEAGVLTPQAVSPVKIVDVEQGCIRDHVELVDLSLDEMVHGTNRHGKGGYEGHHGTAVLGQLKPKGERHGLTGIVPGNTDLKMASHFRENPGFGGMNGNVAEAIVATLLKALFEWVYDPDWRPGSPFRMHGRVLLLEVQRWLLPTEVDPADLIAIQIATASGMVVIEAAGNGGCDLDRYSDRSGRAQLMRGAAGFVDSGAVMVGAARSAGLHDRASYSNYGSRLDCYGWGESVTSCGYGDFHAGSQGVTEYYTNTFNGTSSAAPIIAGTACLLLALYRDKTEVWLSATRTRALLASRSTGTPQGPGVGGNIGVMPNLEAILEDELALVSSLYLRRHIGDDGSGDGPPRHASPDVVLVAKAPASELRRRKAWGEGSGRENVPAPGERFTPGKPHKIFVRSRNRGLAEATNLSADLYACEAATLLTVDDWKRVASLRGGDFVLGGADGTPVGDRLTVSAGAGWNGVIPKHGDGTGHTPEFVAFLAKLWEGDDEPVLPPGGPYFDWQQHRRFFAEHRNVAIRNAHRVAIPQASGSLGLPFLVTGAPHASLDFDLEIEQRLPPGVKVELHAGETLVQGLWQRRPWIEMADSANGIELPAEPGLTFRRIRLAKRARLPVRLEIEQDTGKLLPGHGILIRQLHQGEEVGEISWWFEDA